VTTADASVGYVTGLYAAAQWLAQYGEHRRGYDRDTVDQLVAGLTATTVAAIKRLDVNPDGVNAEDWGVGDAAAYERLRRNEQIRADGGIL
jgi:hypothetical protein